MYVESLWWMPFVSKITSLLLEVALAPCLAARAHDDGADKKEAWEASFSPELYFRSILPNP